MARRHRQHARARALPRKDARRRLQDDFYGDALGTADGVGATLPVTGFAVAAGETLAVGLVAAFGAVVAAGEPAGGAGEVVAAAAGVGIPINSLCNALSLELR